MNQIPRHAAFIAGLAVVAWVGAGYVLNRALKTQVHFERSAFAGGAAKGDRPTENAILWLVQGIL